MSPEQPGKAGPRVEWHHSYGARLVCADGTKHVLSLYERLALRNGCMTVEDLDRLYNSEPQRG